MQSGLFCFRGQNKKLTVWGLCRDNESEYGCRQSVSSSACMWDSLLCFLIRCDHKWWQRTDNYLQQIGIFDLPVCVYYDEDASVASFIHKTNWGGVGGGCCVHSSALFHSNTEAVHDCCHVSELLRLSSFQALFMPATSNQTRRKKQHCRPDQTDHDAGRSIFPYSSSKSNIFWLLNCVYFCDWQCPALIGWQVISSGDVMHATVCAVVSLLREAWCLLWFFSGTRHEGCDKLNFCILPFSLPTATLLWQHDVGFNLFLSEKRDSNFLFCHF